MPLSEYVIFSDIVIPIPCNIPPSACTLARLGLTGVPQSTHASYSTTRLSPVRRSTSTSAAPTMNGGGEIGDVCVLVTESAISLPHMDAVDISARVTHLSLFSPDSHITFFPSNVTSHFSQPNILAPSFSILSLSSNAHFSTALPVTYVVLDAYEPES